MQGYDLELISRVREAISLPMTVLGGAASLDDIEELIRKFGIEPRSVKKQIPISTIKPWKLINLPTLLAETYSRQLLLSSFYSRDSAYPEPMKMM